jgi:hypothetical protein
VHLPAVLSGGQFWTLKGIQFLKLIDSSAVEVMNVVSEDATFSTAVFDRSCL